MAFARRFFGLAGLLLASLGPGHALDLQSTVTPGRAVPSLTNGELAINRADRSLFFKNVDGSIGRGALMDATAAGRKAIEQGDAADLTVTAPDTSIATTLSEWLGLTPRQSASVAALRTIAASKIANGTPLVLAGYYAPGDQGGGTVVWSRTSTATDDGCAVFRPAAIPAGNRGRWLRSISGGVIGIKQCGAKGDGTTDDTGPIQAAINWAESTRSGVSYWSSTDLGSVYLNPGFYTTTGVDTHRQIRVFGDAPGSVTITLRAQANRSAIRAYALPLTDSDAGPGYGQAIFENFTLSGYATGQDANAVSHGIEMPDANYSGTTRYGAGGRFQNLVIAGFRGSCIFIAGNRNLNFIDRVILNYCSQAGIYIAGGADHHISNSSIGANGTGINIYAASAAGITNSAIYNNSGNGLLINGSTGSYVLVSTTTIGANGQHGIAADISNGGRDLILGLSNIHVTDNSQSADNTYSNVYLRNFSQVMLDNVWWMNSGGTTVNQGKYLIDNDTSGLVYGNGLVYATSGAAKAYKTGTFANPTRIRTGTNSTWVDFTPTFSTATGMTVTATGRYRLQDATLSIEVTGTFAFTGATPSGFNMFLPDGFTAKTDGLLTGRDQEAGRGLSTVSILAGRNYGYVTRYDETAPAANNSKIVWSGQVEVQ